MVDIAITVSLLIFIEAFNINVKVLGRQITMGISKWIWRCLSTEFGYCQEKEKTKLEVRDEFLQRKVHYCRRAFKTVVEV